MEVFARVKNLKASRDARLKEFRTASRRQRGVVGIPVESMVVPGFFILTATGTGQSLGVYREDELEPVTKTQLILETVTFSLLSIFPNKNPENVLSFFNAQSPEGYASDVATIRRLLKPLRKVLQSSVAARQYEAEREMQRLTQAIENAPDFKQVAGLLNELDVIDAKAYNEAESIAQALEFE